MEVRWPDVESLNSWEPNSRVDAGNETEVSIVVTAELKAALLAAVYGDSQL